MNLSAEQMVTFTKLMNIFEICGVEELIARELWIRAQRKDVPVGNLIGLRLFSDGSCTITYGLANLSAFRELGIKANYAQLRR